MENTKFKANPRHVYCKGPGVGRQTHTHTHIHTHTQTHTYTHIHTHIYTHTHTHTHTYTHTYTHTHTHSVRLLKTVNSPLQRLLHTQQAQETNINAVYGIRTSDHSNQAAAGLRFRQHGYCHRLD
jgi:hypothetical protein